MSIFLHPWWLLLLPITAWLAYRFIGNGGPTTIQYSSAAISWKMQRTLRQRLAWLPSAFTFIAITTMIFSLARPRDGKEKTQIDSEGIAIELVVDRSSSMRALDFKIDGNHVNRLSAIKNVAGQFVLGEDSENGIGNDELRGRKSDRIGLIHFAGFADAVTPPTLDHRYLVDQLERTEIAATRQEDGTAIGDAISLAVEKLSSLKSKTDEAIQSKVVILLTDGENTAGQVEPNDAAELAKSLGVKIYTIGVGTKGQAPYPVGQSRDGRVHVQMQDVNIDEKTLTAIAETTGGRYFRATDTDSLQEIYAEIDKLERTEFQVSQFMDYRELAVQPFRLRGWKIPPLLLIATFALALRLLLSQTVFRRLA